MRCITTPLCAAQTVQLQLKSSEKTAKDDASPVTIADYGGDLLLVLLSLYMQCACHSRFLHCRAAAGDCGVAHKYYQSELAPDAAGAQAVVAWCLRQSFPDVPLQMVAEEDSADLRHERQLCGTACATCSCCCFSCCACTRHRLRPGCLWRRPSPWQQF